MRLAFVLGLGLAGLAGCSPSLAEECPDARPALAIELPEQCREAEECAPVDEVEALCGRVYECPVEQVGGPTERVCVTAWDCECLAALRECGAEDVYEPGFCALLDND